jgi:hypothetical protein
VASNDSIALKVPSIIIPLERWPRWQLTQIGDKAVAANPKAKNRVVVDVQIRHEEIMPPCIG